MRERGKFPASESEMPACRDLLFRVRIRSFARYFIFARARILHFLSIPFVRAAPGVPGTSSLGCNSTETLLLQMSTTTEIEEIESSKSSRQFFASLRRAINFQRDTRCCTVSA